MDFLSPLFITPLACGVVFALAGFIQMRWPPKKINEFYGYRTKGSRASQERWDFAQQYSGRDMIIWGAVLMILAGIGLIWAPGVMWSTLLSIAMLLAVIWQMYTRTERAMDEEFGEDVI